MDQYYHMNEEDGINELLHSELVLSRLPDLLRPKIFNFRSLRRHLVFVVSGELSQREKEILCKSLSLTENDVLFRIGKRTKYVMQ